MYRDLAVIGTFAGLFGVGHSFSFGKSFASLKNVIAKEEFCLTPACVQAAAHVLGNMHPDYKEIDPCENFDQYVCGGFPKQWPNEKDFDTFTEVQSINKFVLKTILDQPYPESANSCAEDEANFNMLVTNYQSCMNVTAIEASGLGLVPEMIENIAKLFPVNDTYYKSNATISEKDYDGLAKAITYLAKMGVPVFGEFWTVADTQNPDVMIPKFAYNIYTIADHALPSRFTPSQLAALDVGNITMALETILPAGAAKKAAPQLAENLLDVTTAMGIWEAAIIADSKAVVAGSYSTTTIQEATKAAPALVLDKVITALSPKDYKLDRINFQFPEYYANVSSLISSTPRSTIQALLMLAAYQSYAPYIAGSTDPSVDRWDTCFDYLDQSLPWIASKFFVDVAYSNEVKSFFATMANELKEAFSERAKSHDWIAAETKKKIQEKIKEITPKIGYPEHEPNLLNATALATYYTSINITTSFSSNALSIRRWAVSNAFNLLSSPTDTTIWPEYQAHAFIANAQYGSPYNHIVIPAGFSQAPLFFKDAPSYLTYGAAGTIVGHEITHGFDSNGRLWNNDRQFRNWWDEDSVKAFEERAKCFVDQYSGFEVVDWMGENASPNKTMKVFVDGNLTLAENIADAGGINSAYLAWQKHEKSQGKSQLLPGLNGFTREQLFFVAYGQMWCSKVSEELLLANNKANVHAPGLARIVGATQNSASFKETFGCKKREPTCELW